ncbi:MAG: DUF1295 domain-containing protein [Bacteriovoracaceae bacterium]
MIISLLTAILFVQPFYLWAVLKKDFSVIDIGWSLGFITMGLVGFLTSLPYQLPSLLVLSLVLLWGLRLSYYLFRRNHKSHKEDPRYTKMRDNWGKKANLIAYPKIFLLQATLMFIIFLPQIKFFEMNPLELHWTLWPGLTIWLVGFLFETIADQTQNKFKQDSSNKGKFCNVGIWKYCRHPNYFGEVTLWWGMYILVVAFVPWWTILGPVFLTFLILKVSGIPMHEERYIGRADYEAYKKSTNSFFPWFPKKENAL